MEYPAQDHSTLMLAGPDHLAPLLGFVGDELPELGGRGRNITVLPRSANRALITGPVSAALISLLSLSIISACVFFGAPSPTNSLPQIPEQNPPRSGYPAAHRNGSALVTARARSLPGPDVFDRLGHHGKHETWTLPAEKIGHRWRPAAILHLYHVDAGHHLEHLAGQHGAGSRCRPTQVDLTRVGLRVGNEFGIVLGRNCWVDDHDKGRAADARNRRNIAKKVKIKIVDKGSR